ncbi:hypothetical protein [Actinomadura geliboluensis]|uniref:hypothetical protein n=1 Tax=Actinomadura geliboluensis TaxID=882440 RepID=UPI00369C524D
MSLTEPATCPEFDWNPIATAGSWVPFTGGIAAFLFAGLVFLLNTDPHGREESTNAFKLLLTAFFGFLTMAYLTAALSGELTCARAYTGFATTGGVLATSIICMCVALSWLLPSYKRYSEEILPFLRNVIYFIFTLASIMLAVSSLGFVHTTIDANLVHHALIMGAAAAAAVATGFIAVAVKRRNPLSPDQRHRHVKWLARLSLGYLATASVFTGIFMSIPDTAWAPPSDAVIYAVAYGSLAVPLVILVWSLGAIAAKVPDPPSAKPPASAAGEQEAAGSSGSST